jgi:hypothetical protein
MRLGKANKASIINLPGINSHQTYPFFNNKIITFYNSREITFIVKSHKMALKTIYKTSFPKLKLNKLV